MTRAAAAALLLAAVCSGDDRETARTLLERAVEMAPAASPEVHALALEHAGIAWAKLAAARAVALLKQAVTAAGAMPPDREARNAIANDAVRALADIDVEAAIESLGALSEPAIDYGLSPPADRIVSRLIARGDFDRAIDVLALIPNTAAYPATAMDRIATRLPKDDPRRVIVLGRLADAYRRRAFPEFAGILRRHASSMPGPMLESALAAVAQRIGEWKDDPNSISGDLAEETTTFTTPSRKELAGLFTALRELDPKRAERLLAGRQDLRSAAGEKTAASHAPEEPDDSGPPAAIDLLMPLGFAHVVDLGKTDLMRGWFKSIEKTSEVVELAGMDWKKALDGVGGIESRAMRAAARAAIAREQAATDPEGAARTVERASDEASGAKLAGERIPIRMMLAEARLRLKDDAGARQALEAAFADVTELQNIDNNPKRRNTALRDYWPSVNATRMVARRAARMFPAECDAILARVQDPDVAVLARIEMARGLLGLGPSVTQIKAAFSDKDSQ